MSEKVVVSAETVALLEQVPTATLGGQLFKRGLCRQAICGVRQLTKPGVRVAGPAYTMRFIPMREDMAAAVLAPGKTNIHLRAVEQAAVGEIIVADASDGLDGAIFGDILAARMKVRGIRSMVVDGMIRDVPEIMKVDYPAFARGTVAPPNGVSIMPADLQVPINCGGAPVFPGDIIVADDDGAVCIPAYLADEVARDAMEIDELELFVRNKVLEGRDLDGLYPPNEATRAEYEAYRKTKG